MSRRVAMFVVVGLVAIFAASTFAQPLRPKPIRPAPVAEGEETAPTPATGPSPDEVKAFTKALDDALAGKVAAEDIHLGGMDAGATFSVTGKAGFFRDVQIEVPKDTLTAILKRVKDAGFAEMPFGFGGIPRGPLGPMMPTRLIRNFDIRIGAVSKSIDQVNGGEQSQKLQDLLAAIIADLEPLEKKGIPMKDMFLTDALLKISKGEVLPEALEFSFVSSPREGKNIDPTFLLTVNGTGVTFGIKPVPMDRKQRDELIRKLAALLAEKKVDTYPVQLLASKTLLQLNVQVHGVPKSVSMTADIYPHNQDMKKANPDAQKSFDELVDEIMKLKATLTPATQPAK